MPSSDLVALIDEELVRTASRLDSAARRFRPVACSCCSTDWMKFPPTG